MFFTSSLDLAEAQQFHKMLGLIWIKIIQNLDGIPELFIL